MRYSELKLPSGVIIIVDTQQNPPRVMCECSGYYGSINAEIICKSLNKTSEQLGKLIGNNNINST